jgi:hypothetical protein
MRAEVSHPPSVTQITVFCGAVHVVASSVRTAPNGGSVLVGDIER